MSSTKIEMPTRPVAPPARPHGGWARSLVMRRLASLARGSLTVLEHGTRTHFEGTEPGPLATLEVRDARLWRRVVWGGVLGAGEAYADGDWDSPELVDVVRLFLANRDALDAIDGGLARPIGAARRVLAMLPGHGRQQARRDIQAHYDLGNDLFAAFLDPTMTYSSAVYGPDLDPEDPASLEAAQVAKLERICRKLELRPGMRVLEIGCGWGSFALHAARHHGVEVVGTTISPAQRSWAEQRVAEAGLGRRIQVLGSDWRDLDGRFERVVSVEMIEAIGARLMPRFFEALSERLAPDGLCLLQAITIQDRLYEAARRRVDFIKRHVFPGSFIPSMAALTRASAPTGLRWLHVEDIGPSYAATLAAWRGRFEAAWPRLAARGASDRFRRLWRYYLAYCEGGFREGVLGDIQGVLAGDRAAVPSWIERPEPLP
ncbi:MAG: cyclopropane-fatty-acyl-phospholipid synthase family protein [Planctomycetota bacterium]